MTDEERVLWNAVKEADLEFEKDGATSTKCWIREYFFPSLERHGLKVVPDQPKFQNPCLLAAEEGEPIFVLRAKDPLASQTVMYWLTCAQNRGLHADKVDGAVEVAHRMLQWYEENVVK